MTSDSISEAVHIADGMAVNQPSKEGEKARVEVMKLLTSKCRVVCIVEDAEVALVSENPLLHAMKKLLKPAPKIEWGAHLPELDANELAAEGFEAPPQKPGVLGLFSPERGRHLLNKILLAPS
jgi:hypothetical protein